jgi:hypothetical protein
MVKPTATGTIASQVPHRMTEAFDNNLNQVFGNGGIALSTLRESNVTSAPNNVQTGDFGFEQILVLAVVAIAGVSAALNTRLKRRRK